VPHALLLEIFTDEGVGTMVVPDSDAGSGASGALEGRDSR
jgi:acetylglutamate kinase